MNKNRRHILRVGYLVGLLVAIHFALGSFSLAAGKKNVLFIAVDDLRPELSCYGKSGIRTPNIDRLAASGVVFENHYVQFAVCIPSRVSLLTSLRPERTHQVYGPSVWQKVTDGRPLGKTFHANGYRTVSLGKIWHVGDGNTGDSFDVKWSPQGGMYADPAYEEAKANFRKNNPKGATKGTEDASGFPPITEAADVPDNTYADGQIGDRALAELREAKAAGSPFMLAVGFHKPHLPFCSPKKYWDLYNEDDMPLAANPDFPEGMPEVAFSGHPNMFNYNYGDYERFVLGKRMPDRTARHLLHAYRAATSFIDAQVGRLLDELERLGLSDNTIVVLWGDHGWHLGDSGHWSKHTNFEAAAHSPLIVRAPGYSKSGARSAGLVETVDIFPTLLDLCGLPELALFDGKSFAPLLKNPQAEWKEAVFHVFNRNRTIDGKGQTIIGHAVRTQRYRLVSWRLGWGMKGREIAAELYDYEKDPWETKNVADEPDYASVRKQLETRLQEGPAGSS